MMKMLKELTEKESLKEKLFRKTNTGWEGIESKKKEELKPIIHEDKIPENVNTISDDQFFDDFFDD